MKVSISREAFSVALAEAASVVAKRTPKPVLQCVLLRTVDGAVVVMATDLETSLRIMVPQAEIEEPGDALVSADKLNSIARESQDEIIQLETDERVCHVRGHDSHFQIFTQEVSDYPPVLDLEGEVDAEVPARELARAITCTMYAAAKESTRFAINGLLWEKRKKDLRVVATDGRRLALARVRLSEASAKDHQVIVPLKAMGPLLRVLGETDESVRMQLAPNQIVAQAGLATLSSTLVEGHFPRYEDVVPRDNDKIVHLKAEELLRAIRQAALLTTHESRGIRLSFQKGQLELTSRAPEEGEARIVMPIEYDYEPLAIGFNPVFLMEMLRTVESETVDFDLKEANRPGVLRVGEDFTYVVMPVNLS